MLAAGFCRMAKHCDICRGKQMRYIFENRKMPFAAMSSKGLSKTPHIHPHLEMVYMTEGCTMASLDGKEYPVEKGDLYLSFPNQIHFYHDQGETAEYVLIFAGELFPDFAELFRNKAALDPVVRHDRLPEDLYLRLRQVYERSRSGNANDMVAARGFMLTVLADVLPLMRLTDTPVSQDSIKSVLIYCMENYTEPLTLETLAEDLHLSKYYISHIFQKRLGTGFSEFLNGLRLDHACGLLSRGRSVTEVAYASGFSSIRSFNRIFMEKMGMTPSQYIRQKG